MKKFAAFGLMAAIFSAPTYASSYGVELKGHVPVSCHVSGQLALVDITDAAANLGEIREFCNNAAGYDLYIDHAPTLAGAVVMIDGVSIELDNVGSTAIAAEAGPALRTRDVQIDLSGVQETDGLTISFRIVPR